MILNPTFPYAVELDGQLVVHQQGGLQPVADVSRLTGDCRLVSDFQDAISRTMSLEADTRYIELMISRKLQETGEFDEPVTVITHWKKKRGKNAADIYFTAVPSKRYFRYLELVGEHRDHLVLLPLQSLLLTMLKRYGKEQPVAVVLQHDRFADLLVGSRRKIWYANRVAAFDNSPEQISALWETVRTDIETQAGEHHQPVDRLIVATWVDSGPLPQWTDDGAPDLVRLEEQVVRHDGRDVPVSMPGLIAETPVGQAVAPPTDKLLSAARHILPYFNALLLLTALCLAGVGAWYGHRATALEAQIHTQLQQAQNIHARAPQQIEAVPYASTFDFVKDLWTSRRLPGYRQILADVGQGTEGILQVKNIKADYSSNKVEVKAFGEVIAPFENAHKAYQDLCRRLTRRGYTLTEERFDTRINESNFVLGFAKEAR